MSLYIDDCQRCACVTHLSRFTKEEAIAGIERGDVGCANCEEDGDHHTEFALFETNSDGTPNMLWDGRSNTPQSKVQP